MAVVEVRLQMRELTDKEGNRRTTADVVADNVYFVDSKRDGDSANISRGYQAPADYGVLSGSDPFAEMGDEDGDLPF